MKKLIYTTILFFIISSSQAQIKDYGVRLGGSLANIGGTAFNRGESWGDFSYTSTTGETIKGTKSPLFGLNPTLFIRYDLSDKIFLQPEIGISFNGFKQTIDKEDKYSSSNSTAKISFTYLQIPLLAGYKVGNSDFQPFIMAGFTPAFLLSNSVKGESASTVKSTGVQTKSSTEQTGDADKTFDLGFTIGAGIMTIPSMPRLGADIRYNLGTTNLFETSSYTAYNNVLSIALYYRFNQ